MILKFTLKGAIKLIKKTFTSLMLATILLAGNYNEEVLADSHESVTSVQNNELVEIAEAKVAQRIAIGDSNFNHVEVSKVKKMKDINEKDTKYMVLLNHKNNKTIAGYMIVDALLENKDAVVEFAIGSEYPGYEKDEKLLYYLGPVQYGIKDKNNNLKDLRTGILIDENSKEKIKIIEKEKYSEYNSFLQEESIVSAEEATTASVVNRIYRKISGVPDYQDSDYPGANDCSPVASGNIVMYWDANGYPNMSYDNTPSSMIARLHTFMSTHPIDGTTGTNLENGLDRYMQERYANANSDRRLAPSFANLANEIAAKRPALIHLRSYNTEGDSGLGHSVTLVGTESYQETSQNLQYYYNLIIHDVWASTPTDVWISFGRGGHTVYAHTVVSPYGL